MTLPVHRGAPGARFGSPADELLARRVADGDQGAFPELFSRHQAALYQYCLRMVRHSEDAQDVLQATMLSAYGAMDGRAEIRIVKAWLFRAARNQCLTLIRTRSRARDGPPLAPGAGPTGEEQIAELEARDELDRDLDDLPSGQRQALLLQGRGFGHKEIAAALGGSAGSVAQLVRDGRRSLRQIEGGRGTDCETVRQRLSAGDRRTSNARGMRAHLRDCAACRRFEESMQRATFSGPPGK